MNDMLGLTFLNAELGSLKKPNDRPAGSQASELASKLEGPSRFLCVRRLAELATG